MMVDVSVRVMPWRQWSEFAPAWEEVHELSADTSFFLSREWVDCWLATFGADLNPQLLAFEADGSVVGCCLLVWRTNWVWGVPVRRVYLNCAGENEADSTCIEYNSLVCVPYYETAVAKALGRFLSGRYWDELMLWGVVEHSALWAVGSLLGRGAISEKPAHYIDFQRLRGAPPGLDSVLSSNVRQQILRSRRIYEETHGPCNLRAAVTVAEAMEIFGRLADMHQGAWQERGGRGVFGSPRFLGFHRRLIEQTFDSGKMLLIEVQAGDVVIGVLYSFLYLGRLYFYRSGFRFTSDGRLKPGLVTHYLTIQYCLEKPELEEYDFLAGDSQYKRSLATNSRPLRWIVIRRLTLPSLLLRGFELLKRRNVQTL